MTEADSAQSEDVVTEGNIVLSQLPTAGSVEPSEKIEDRCVQLVVYTYWTFYFVS